MIPIENIKTNKFKTISIQVKFKAPLEEETMLKRSIISKLIQKSSQLYPSEQQLMNQLANMYGAQLYSNVIKQNNAHVMTVGIDIINDKFLETDEALLEASFKLLNEVIFHPHLQGEAFNYEMVKQEKRLLQNKADAIKDNKGQYGFYQLLKAMFTHEAYRFPAFGDITSISDITPQNLYAYYLYMMENDEINIYITGDTEERTVEELSSTYLNFKHNTVNIQPMNVQHQKVNHIVEHTNTNQARLNIGMKFDVEHPNHHYFPFLVLNQMFGGDPSSLLFMNVREKYSLAYQIHTQVDARLGLLYILSGVNQENRIKAIETIEEQFKLLVKGDFSEELLATAKRMLINHRKESLDRPKGLIETHYANTFGKTITQNEWIEGISKVTKEDIMAVAGTGYFHTVYCLTSEGSE